MKYSNIIPINGNGYDNNEDDEEWDDNTIQYQLINHIKDINMISSNNYIIDDYKPINIKGSSVII